MRSNKRGLKEGNWEGILSIKARHHTKNENYANWLWTLNSPQRLRDNKSLRVDKAKGKIDR